MSTPPGQTPQSAAQPLRDMLVRVLMDASLSEARLKESGELLEQVVETALQRHEQRGPLQREITALRGEIAQLREEVQRLPRTTGAAGGLAWPAVLLVVAAAIGVTYLVTMYVKTPGRPAVTAAAPAADDPPVRVHRSASAASVSQVQRPQSAQWEHVWDMAVTQAFTCPGDPGASTLLQCACPDVHPAPPAGYPYEGVGGRCPPGDQWAGRLAVAGLQAVLRVQEPELDIEVNGVAGKKLTTPLALLQVDCPDHVDKQMRALLSPADEAAAGAAALAVLKALRNDAGCLAER